MSTKKTVFVTAIIVFAFCTMAFGYISYRLDMKQYTLYASSRSDDRFQDMYVASFSDYDMEQNQSLCKKMKARLLPDDLKKAMTNYECRRGPYMPYKFMIARGKPSWFSWKVTAFIAEFF